VAGLIVVADTSWVAALRDPEDAHHADAVATNAGLGEDDRIFMAPLTLAECLVGPALLGVAEEAEHRLRLAFEVTPDDETAPLRWALRRAASGLKLPDAIVLEAAVHVGASTIATFDDRLAETAARAGLRILGGLRALMRDA
jgi:predicted nucleic acid-binding protein